MYVCYIYVRMSCFFFCAINYLNNDSGKVIHTRVPLANEYNLGLAKEQ